jgi:hypothetical protein
MEGLINTHEYFPIGPLLRLYPLLWKLIPPLLHICPSVANITFIFINTIYNVYMLHYRSCGRTSYLHYISIKWGLNIVMLHSHTTTNFTVLDAKHHTSMHRQNLHDNTR